MTSYHIQYYFHLFFTTGVVLFKENLSGVLLYGLPIYTVLLLTTCWRAIARVESLKVN